MEIDTIDISLKEINRNLLTGWTAYFYVNNELIRYNSTTHNWTELPKIGVQCLWRHYAEGYSEMVNGVDYYCPYQLMNVDDIRPYIKFGKFIDDDEYMTSIAPFIINDPINH